MRWRKRRDGCEEIDKEGNLRVGGKEVMYVKEEEDRKEACKGLTGESEEEVEGILWR